MTEKRQRLLAKLQEDNGALSAADIHAKLSDIDLVTIYRNLELFTKEKLIKQFHLGNGEARYEYQAMPHHHAVCSECERILHFTAPDTKIKRLLQIEDFAVDEIEVIVRGKCKHENKNKRT
jgi:Fur family peroxide stress response transcriptional regulator